MCQARWGDTGSKAWLFTEGNDGMYKSYNGKVIFSNYTVSVGKKLEAFRKQKINDIAKIVDMSFDNPYDEIKSFFTTSMPIVGIGAPVHLYLEPVARALGTQAIVPSEAGVANAVGAITGSIISEEMVFIRPNYDVSGITGYSCHSSRNYFEAKDYNAALFWAKQEAVKNAKEQAAMMGALDVNIEMQSYDRRGDTKEGREVLLLETVVTARGVGRVFSFKDMN